MPSLQILSTGRLDERDSAFPQAVQLPSGDVLCSFGVGGGQFVHGGTDWVRSTDGGLTWRLEGTLLPPTSDPPSANFLKLSLSADGKTIYAYGTRYWGSIDDKFGERRGEALFCVSTDDGRSWSSPQVIPMPDVPLEVSHSMLPLASGRLLFNPYETYAEETLKERGILQAAAEAQPRAAPVPFGLVQQVGLRDDPGRAELVERGLLEDEEVVLGRVEHVRDPTMARLDQVVSFTPDFEQKWHTIFFVHCKLFLK